MMMGSGCAVATSAAPGHANIAKNVRTASTVPTRRFDDVLACTNRPSITPLLAVDRRHKPAASTSVADGRL
jgi:hypothetical protein